MKTWLILFILIVFAGLVLFTPAQAIAEELCVDNDM